jgi:hypothetical protein
MINVEKLRLKLEEVRKSYEEELKDGLNWAIEETNRRFQAYEKGWEDGYGGNDPVIYREGFTFLQQDYDDGYQDGRKEFFIDRSMENDDLSQSPSR